MNGNKDTRPGLKQKKISLFHATGLFSKVVGGSCLGVGSICFQITDMGLSLIRKSLTPHEHVHLQTMDVAQ
jgi:hypothetical protein